jgi:hypothetical protein
MSLYKIQRELKAPKGQLNKFGNYKYRSCEDIVEAVKPLLHDFKYSLVISDDIVDVGGRIYVKASAQIIDEKGNLVASANGYAREAESKKGMDDSQITGSASSYARKYALNGLLAIDDTKDADATNTHDSEPVKPAKRINKEMMQKYMVAMLDALDAGDGLGLRELGDELRDDEDLMSAVWKNFNSKQQAAMKKLLNEVKDETAK